MYYIYPNPTLHHYLLRDLLNLNTPQSLEYYDDLEFIFQSNIPLDPEYLEEIQEYLKLIQK